MFVNRIENRKYIAINFFRLKKFFNTNQYQLVMRRWCKELAIIKLKKAVEFKIVMILVWDA